MSYDGLAVTGLSNVTLNTTHVYPRSYACPQSDLLLSGSIQVVILLLVFTLGVVGNLAVLLVVGCPRYQKGSLDIYLWNLAFSDLVSALSLATWAIESHSSWIFGDLACKILSAQRDQSLYTGVLLLFSVCVQTATKVNRPLLCMSAWLFGVLLALPAVLFNKTSRLSAQLSVCHLQESRVLQFPFGLFRNLFGLVIPVLLFIFVGVAYDRLRKAEFKAKKEKALVLSLTLAFAIFQSPYYGSMFIKALQSSHTIKVSCQVLDYTTKATNFTLLLRTCHHFVNPIIYSLFWSKIRGF